MSVLGVDRAVDRANQHAVLEEDLALGNARRRLVDLEVVGRHESADDRLAETEGRLDHNGVAVVGDRVNGEHHPGRLRLNHLLHGNGEIDVKVSPTRLFAVEDGARFEQ